MTSEDTNISIIYSSLYFLDFFIDSFHRRLLHLVDYKEQVTSWGAFFPFYSFTLGKGFNEEPHFHYFREFIF